MESKAIDINDAVPGVTYKSAYWNKSTYWKKVRVKCISNSDTEITLDRIYPPTGLRTFLKPMNAGKHTFIPI